MTPSDTTRHRALEVSERGADDADFDFLTQRGNKFNWKPLLWLWRGALSLLLLIVLILLAVDVSKKDKKEGWPLSSGRCLFPLGGGETAIGGHLQTSQLVSKECLELFKDYFSDNGQYWMDTRTAIDAARGLLDRKGNSSQLVILDIDETSLSNLPLYRTHDFGPNAEQRSIWFRSTEAPPIPATLQLYQDLRKQGFSVVFLTGRSEEGRNNTMRNLSNVGFGSQCEEDSQSGEVCYHVLIMREDEDDRDALVYKDAERRKLTRRGFELVASIGDQWSDLLGNHRPTMIVKMPNPLYYLP